MWTRAGLIGTLLVGWLGASLPVLAAESVNTVLQNAEAAATANGTEMNVSGMSTAGLQITVSATATIVLEVSANGTTYVAKLCTLTTDASTASSVTASGVYQCNVAGMSTMRARITANTGTVTVFGKATSAVFSGAGGIAGTASASAPSLAEGAAGYFYFDLSGNLRVSLGTLLSGEDQTNSLLRVNGGAVRSVTLMTGVTTNTTSANVAVFSGGKTPMASVTGTGAQTATVTFYGDMENTTTHGEALCSIVLSGTTKAVGACQQFSKDYPYYHAVTTVVTGTGATVAAIMASGIDGNGITNDWLASGLKVADALIKTGAGRLQCILISQNDAAPTVGTISVNDAVSAGTGTALFTWVLTSTVFTPFQVCPQVPFATGLYFDFTTTADVNVSASYR